MLATHRTYKLLTYIQKAKKNTHTHKYAPVALYKNKNKVQQESCAGTVCRRK